MGPFQDAKCLECLTNEKEKGNVNYTKMDKVSFICKDQTAFQKLKRCVQTKLLGRWLFDLMQKSPSTSFNIFEIQYEDFREGARSASIEKNLLFLKLTIVSIQIPKTCVDMPKLYSEFSSMNLFRKFNQDNLPLKTDKKSNIQSEFVAMEARRRA